MGDFYETFFEDAVTVAKVLDIALTSRDKGPNKTPMAGIPYHALDSYLGKLIDAGYKVAIAEQHEQKLLDEKTGKTKIVINRNIKRIVTPSTYETDIDTNSNFLVCIDIKEIKQSESAEMRIFLCCIDPNGSQFWTTTFQNFDSLDNELFRINSKELLLKAKTTDLFLQSRFVSKNLHRVTPIEENYFENSKLLEHFQVKSLRTFGVEEYGETLVANACFSYLSETQKSSLIHINKIFHKNLTSNMRINSNTLRNLEIVTSTHGGTALLDVLDHTNTRGGKRLLREWITSPLTNTNEIELRLEAVKHLIKSDFTDLISSLNKIQDLERIAARISYETIMPRDFISLLRSLENVKAVQEFLSQEKNLPALLESAQKEIIEKFEILNELMTLVEKNISDPAPSTLKDGHFINQNVSEELDELKEIASNSKKWLRNLEIMEQQKTGISTLRVKYNRVFGYFIEVTKGQVSKVPESYIRKQTTVNGERYITTELKEKESMILSAGDRMQDLETEIYRSFVKDSQKFVPALLFINEKTAEIDTLLSFAVTARMYDYCEPKFNAKENSIHAIDARHPVVERVITDQYIYNDIHIKNGEIMLITGPNMGGKSTYIRMVALITYMAHIGSYVPARECSMSEVDNIFTRVGAADDLSRGESTFMVEMTEAANILHNATEKSLIILDEIGRGTSTYDGMSIAWAIVNFIHEKIKAKTLFATHYHELTVLEKELNGLKNYTVAISEKNDTVVFLRKIEAGKAEKSFGIHVARLAGLPQNVLDKATEILTKLEMTNEKNDTRQMALWESNDQVNSANTKSTVKFSPDSIQDLTFEKIITELQKLDVNNITPVQALEILARLSKDLKEN